MADFEFLDGFFSLLIGLIVAQLATRFTDAIEEREGRPIGLLTPLLAANSQFYARPSLNANMNLGGLKLVPHSNWAESVKIASMTRSK